MQTNVALLTAGMFLIPLVVVLLPVLLGQRYGLYVRRKSGEFQEAPVGSVVGAALGLLAFMLAFTFDMVSNRYSDRKELLLDEVTDIRTTYLRAGLIPEPIRSESRKALVEYVDVRAELARNVSKTDYAISRSQQLLDSLWKGAEALASEDRSSEAYSLYTGSVNDLVDLYNKRITLTLQYRIPDVILYVLCIIAFFSMLTLGYQFGISGKQNFMINVVLAIVFAAVMWIILALDYPETGLIRLNQQPVFSLQEQLHHEQSQ